MNKGIIICGIDTDCGKSVASILIYEYFNLYFSPSPIIVKPMQTGQKLDTDFYQQCNIPKKNIFNFYSLSSEASLHTAANLTNQKIDMYSLSEKIKALQNEKRTKIFELAGGILSPINDTETMLDFVKLLKLPIILVVDNYLGSINHALLTIHLLESEHVKIAGIIYNSRNSRNHSTESFQYLANNTCIPQIGKIPYLKNLKYFLKSEEEKQNLIKRWHLNV